MRKLLLCLLIAGGTVHAAAPAVADAEIDHLLLALQESGCEFERNGSWHSAADARKHLQRKRDYLEKRKPIVDTESFIAQAATKSSMSGKPYRVRCGAAAAEPSRTWLMRELESYRARES